LNPFEFTTSVLAATKLLVPHGVTMDSMAQFRHEAQVFVKLETVALDPDFKIKRFSTFCGVSTL